MLSSSISLGKTKTDLCNECYSVNLRLQDPDVSPEDEDELRLRLNLNLHLNLANMQRGAMNVYIIPLTPMGVLAPGLRT